MSTKRPIICALAAATAALTAAPPAGAETTLAVPLVETRVKAHAGHLLYSTFERAGAYRLTVRAPDGAVRTLPTPPQPGPFDADIGSDSAGRPQVIYTRCGRTRFQGTSVQRSDCDLYVFSLVRPGGERPVRNANTTDASEETPTLWKGRVAFSRVYDGRELPLVYTKELVAPRSRPSARLSGIPARRNGRPTFDAEVFETELYGRNLGLSVGFTERGPREFQSREREVRLSFVEGGAPRQVAATGVGEGGQSWVGVSFADGRMGFALSCLGDPGGCVGRSGIYRYSISGGAYGLERRRVDRLFGHALVTLNLSFAQRRCDVEPGRPIPCPIVLTDPLDFREVRPPR